MVKGLAVSIRGDIYDHVDMGGTVQTSTDCFKEEITLTLIKKIVDQNHQVPPELSGCH